MTLATQDTIPSITASLAAALTEQTRIQIHSDGNSLLLPNGLHEEALRHVIARLGAMQGQTEKLDAMLRYNIGRAVMQLASSGPEKRDIDEVIDESELPKLLQRSAKTISNWTYVARVIPPEDLRPVSWTVLSEAAAAVPAEPDAAMQWRQERGKLLDEAVKHPEQHTAKAVREKVKQLQTQINPSTGKEKPVRESTNELLLRFVKLSRLGSVAHSGQLREIGIDTHGVLVDMLEALSNELINRDVVQPDPLEETFYWIKKPIEAEIA